MPVGVDWREILAMGARNFQGERERARDARAGTTSVGGFGFTSGANYRLYLKIIPYALARGRVHGELGDTIDNVKHPGNFGDVVARGHQILTSTLARPGATKSVDGRVPNRVVNKRALGPGVLLSSHCLSRG